jgi:hypothetical protein
MLIETKLIHYKCLHMKSERDRRRRLGFAVQCLRFRVYGSGSGNLLGGGAEKALEVGGAREGQQHVDAWPLVRLQRLQEILLPDRLMSHPPPIFRGMVEEAVHKVEVMPAVGVRGGRREMLSC